MNMKLTFLSIIAIALSACATASKQETPPPSQPRQEPVISKPVPVAPMEEQRIDSSPQIVDAGPIPGTIEHFAYVSGGDRVYFGYNEYTLTPQTSDVLRAQAQWLQSYPNSIVVVGGHADERGTREYNLALAARRADAVKAFLVGQGVVPSRITTVSYGKERPIDGRSNEAAWALNRNAHSVVLIGGNS